MDIFEFEKKFLGLKGHPLSIKFRSNLEFIASYAIEMDHYLKRQCNDLREKCEAIRQEYGIGEYDGPLPLDSKYEGPLGKERFKKDEERYEKERKKQEEELGEEERAERDLQEEELDGMESELNDRTEDYPQLLFQSLFIAVYSRFERFLFDLCNDLRKSESFTLKPKHLHGKGIERDMLYLEKVARLNTPKNTEEWRVIKLLRDIRNSLVHDPERFHIRQDDKVDPKLLDYFWLHDESLVDFDVESTDFMFSLDSIQKILNTFVRFSKDIDEAWEEYDNLRKKFQQGAKHKK